MNIAREAYQLHAKGQSLHDINATIKKNYGKYGNPTPTPVPQNG